jgi:hypothetical protein
MACAEKQEFPPRNSLDMEYLSANASLRLAASTQLTALAGKSRPG